MQIIVVLEQPLFPLGQIVATPGALAALQEANHLPAEFLSQHARGEWGDLCEEDWQQNDLCLREGCRLFSAYVLSTGQKLWIVTERDRSVTTLLLPDEY
jgi:hypothetical protein